MKNLNLQVLLAFLSFFQIAYTQQPNLQWAARFPGPSGSDKGIAIVLDSTGHSYVTAKSAGVSTGTDMLTIKYNSVGDTVWTRRFNGTSNGNDEPISLKRDGDGNIYVIGKTQRTNLYFDMVTIKYDSLGSQKWIAIYNGAVNNGDDIPFDLTFDESLNIYVVGSSYDVAIGGGVYDNRGYIVKYDSFGVQKWAVNKSDYITLVSINNIPNIVAVGYADFEDGYTIYELNPANGAVVFDYDGGTLFNSRGFPNAMVIDNVGNMFITSSWPRELPRRVYTAKYTHSIEGATWAPYQFTQGDGPFTGVDIKLDGNLNVYTLASFFNNSNFRFFIKKLSPSGTTLWYKTYEAQPGIDQHPVSLSLKRYGINPDIFASGYTSESNIYTLKFDPEDGDTLWTVKYDCGNNGTDVASRMVQDSYNNIYITGYSNCNGTSDDIKTLKYCVSAPAQPEIISGDISVCQGSSETYIIQPVPGATSYTWSLPVGWTGSSNTTSITVVPSSSGSLSITANGQLCSSIPRSLSVVVNKPPIAPTLINGETNLCSGTLNAFSIISVPGATSYTWSSPGAPSITTPDLSISFIATTSGNISVHANNECGSSPEILLNINVTPTPSTPAEIFGDTIVCNGDELTLSILPEVGVNYEWTIPLGWGIESNTGSTIVVYPEGSETVSVFGTLGNCSSGIQVLNIISYGTPSIPTSIYGQNDICIEKDYPYYINSVNGATSYTWSWPEGWIVNITSDTSILVTADSSGTLYATAENICDTSQSQQLYITVHTEAPLQPGPIMGADTACPGATILYTVDPVDNASYYIWIIPFGWKFVGDDSTTNSVMLKVGPTGSTLRVKAANECDKSEATERAIQICSVNTIDPQLAESTYMIPNPTSGDFTVTNDGFDIKKIDVFDITGEIVQHSDSYSASTKSINISHCSSGLYFVRIYLGNGIVTKRLVKL